MNITFKKISTFFAVTLLSITILAAIDSERPKNPNIILILTDDLGWQDVTCYDIDEASPMETPNLDALAKQGVLFWQAYSPAPTCAPTRCAIMSGNHPARAQKTHVVGGGPPTPYKKDTFQMMPPWYSGRMPDGEMTVARVLQQNGYATGHCGKWHMAINHYADPQPLAQGFDWTRSRIGTTKRMLPNRMTGFATTDAKDPYRLDENGYPYHQNSEDAMDFIKEHKDQPFFLYYATWLVHTPIHTRSRELLDKYVKKLGVELPENPNEWKGQGQTNPFYCAMVEELDYYMGRLFAFLDAVEDPRWPGHKLSENTYIIFTSDNGGMERVPREIITDNYPLDRGKISIMEGGIRVPFIVKGPGIAENVESDVLVNGLDFYPTILSLAGVDLPESKHVDGSDLKDLLLQDPTDPNLVLGRDGQVRDAMMWHFPHSVALESAIRQGDWKLVRNYNHVANRGTPNEFELYRLYETMPDGSQKRVDIEEANNLAKAMPKKVALLNARLTEILEEMDASYPYYNPDYSGQLPNKDTVPTVLSSSQNGNRIEVQYKENGADVVRANLIYTDNGGARYEEWYRKPATIASDSLITAELPEGTTHYYINLIDENNFLESYPEVVDRIEHREVKSYALGAIEVRDQL